MRFCGISLDTKASWYIKHGFHTAPLLVTSSNFLTTLLCFPVPSAVLSHVIPLQFIQFHLYWPTTHFTNSVKMSKPLGCEVKFKQHKKPSLKSPCHAYLTQTPALSSSWISKSIPYYTRDISIVSECSTIVQIRRDIVLLLGIVFHLSADLSSKIARTISKHAGRIMFSATVWAIFSFAIRYAIKYDVGQIWANVVSSDIL